MSRTLTPDMLTAISAKGISPVRLVAMHFDGGSQFHTTAYRRITWGNNVYMPGNLLAIGQVKESLSLQVPTLNISFSGVNQANLSTALTENSIDREVIVFLGLLDINEQLIINPVEEFKGRLDSYTFKENSDNGNVSIAWSCVSHLQDFERIAGRISNDDDQQFWFPGDKGFEFSALVSRDIKWGRA